MQVTRANDMNGDEVTISTRIKAYLEGQEYTAVITGFEQYYGNIVRITAIRDDDGTEVKAFSDAIVRFRS
jgi:hypothetical protein